MPSVTLHSWQIGRFIELRRLSGTDYQSQAKLLGYFDRFVLEEHLTGPPVTRQIIEQYLQSLAHLRPRVQYNRFCVVRQLCESIAQSDPSCYVPEPMKCGSAQKASSARPDGCPCIRPPLRFLSNMFTEESKTVQGHQTPPCSLICRGVACATA